MSIGIVDGWGEIRLPCKNVGKKSRNQIKYNSARRVLKGSSETARMQFDVQNNSIKKLIHTAAKNFIKRYVSATALGLEGFHTRQEGSHKFPVTRSLIVDIQNYQIKKFFLHEPLTERYYIYSQQ